MDLKFTQIKDETKLLKKEIAMEYFYVVEEIGKKS